VTIKRWWRRYPTANVGIACSSTAGPIVVDVDGRTGKKIVRELELLGYTAEASSRAGRLHLYFAPMGDGTTIARMIRPLSKEVALDILGDGGYVVAPPSIHPDTRERYQWVNGDQHAMRPFPRRMLSLLSNARNIKKVAPPLPEVIHEGERDTILTSLAGTMRRRGASQDAILAALREENVARVRPPLKDHELQRIASSIGRKDPAPVMEHATDLGNARRFITQHRDRVRSILSHRRPWLLWDGLRFVPDDTGEVERMGKDTVRALYTEAAQIPDEEQRNTMLKHALRSEGAQRIRAMLELASSEKEISAVPSAFDANRWLLNVVNGTVNLKTGKLQPHSRSDLITKLAPVEYDPTARAPRWERFLMEIMGGDEELVEFLQRAVGYSLTGDTREQCLFFCYGQGANGKSTFLETLRAVLGDYAQQSDFSSFLARNGDGPRTDIARMRGARFVTASEAHGHRDFDAKTVQSLTGTDTVVARHLYEREFEFKPQHKLWLAANHKPVVKEQTEAFWRRMRLLPFTVMVPKEKRDKRLGRKLRREAPGILAWAIEGCLRWQQQGLIEPDAVRKATLGYKNENDVLGEFMEQCAAIEATGWTPVATLYRAFCDWWADTRGPRSAPLSPVWFGRLMSERPEFRQVKRHGMRGWKGISLKIDHTPKNV